MQVAFVRRGEEAGNRDAVILNASALTDDFRYDVGDFLSQGFDLCISHWSPRTA